MQIFNDFSEEEIVNTLSIDEVQALKTLISEIDFSLVHGTVLHKGRFCMKTTAAFSFENKDKLIIVGFFANRFIEFCRQFSWIPLEWLKRCYFVSFDKKYVLLNCRVAQEVFEVLEDRLDSYAESGYDLVGEK